MTLSSAEIAGFEATQEASMQDVCTIKRNALSTDSYGDPTETPTTTTDVACGVVLKGGSKTDEVTKQQMTWDALLRLPRSIATIGLNDEIVITAVKGRSVSHSFRLASPPAQGNTAKLIYLKRTVN